ncbi:PLP-dependent aminotransferase family protein [Brevibacterium samyangense]|uniref:PLP-dependent aminotransferase family protein n=1 Tax=Brevibacterium samyangense TaxID=366888 RepID=A0ABN2TFI2_9MICO
MTLSPSTQVPTESRMPAGSHAPTEVQVPAEPEAPATPSTPAPADSVPGATTGSDTAHPGAPRELNRHVAGATGSAIRNIFKLAAGPDVISFAGGTPANELFDTVGIAQSYAHVIDTIGGRALNYGSVEGEPEMKEAAAKRLSESSCATSPDQLLITSGSQQGLGLCGQTLINPGDVVLAENPTFMSALGAFKLQGAVCRGVESDEFGILPEDLEAKILEHSPKALYTIPTFQNPTGSTMPAERRTAIADVIARHSIWLIEDDPYSELRYEGEPVPAISTDPRIQDKSLLLGTLSKVLAPGLRIGWIRGPEWILERLATAKQATSLQTSTIDQMAAAHYIEHNSIPEKLLAVKDAYRQRRDTMLEVLPTVLPEGTSITRPDGGMFLWAKLPDGFDATALVEEIGPRGTVYVPGSTFFVENPDPATIRFSFVSNAPARIEEGLLRMKPVFDAAAAAL